MPRLWGIYVTLHDDSVCEMDNFLLHDGYLFSFRRLCIPRTSLRDFLSWEMHTGGLIGHVDQNKMIEAVEHKFYWPRLKRDVAKIVDQCRTCQLAKQQKTDCQVLHSSPCAQLPLARRELKFHTRIAKNVEKVRLYPNSG